MAELERRALSAPAVGQPARWVSAAETASSSAPATARRCAPSNFRCRALRPARDAARPLRSISATADDFHLVRPAAQCVSRVARHIMPSVKRAITVHGGGRGFRRKFHPGPGQHVNPGRKAQVTRAARRRGHDRTRQTTRQSTLNALKVRARARRGLLEEWNYVESTAQGLSPAAVNRLRARVGALSRAMTGRCDDDWKAEKPAAAVMKAQRAAAKRILEYRRRGASSSIERGIMAEAAAAFDDDDDGAGGSGAAAGGSGAAAGGSGARRAAAGPLGLDPPWTSSRLRAGVRGRAVQLGRLCDRPRALRELEAQPPPRRGRRGRRAPLRPPGFPPGAAAAAASRRPWLAARRRRRRGSAARRRRRSGRRRGSRSSRGRRRCAGFAK